MWVYFVFWTLTGYSISSKENKYFDIKNEIPQPKRFTDRSSAINFYNLANIYRIKDSAKMSKCKNDEDTLKMKYPLITKVKLDSMRYITGDNNNLPLQ